MKRTPRIAVVGEVNKGKSSLVSALCQNDLIVTGPRPGTTEKSQSYAYVVDNEPVFEIYDTPGFQAPRPALQWLKDWLKKNASSSPSEIDAVEAFLETFDGNGDFVTECEILRPVMSGAGALFVVDSSVSPKPNIGADLNILKMTGAPMLLVINQTDPARDYEDEWARMLRPHGKVSKFNTHRSNMAQRLSLLESFKGVEDGDWAKGLDRCLEKIGEQSERRLEESVSAIAELLADALKHHETKKRSKDADIEVLQAGLESRFWKWVDKRRKKCRAEIESIYDHRSVSSMGEGIPDFELSITDQRTWQVFGMSRKQFACVGAGTGAAVGGGVDATVGGADLMLGTAIGAGVGYAVAYFAGPGMSKLTVRAPLPKRWDFFPRKKLGKELRQVTIEAPQDTQYALVLLNTALSHHQFIMSLSHAVRGNVDIPSAGSELEAKLSKEQVRDLSNLLKRIRKSKGATVPDDLVDELEDLVLSAMRSGLELIDSGGDAESDNEPL